MTNFWNLHCRPCGALHFSVGAVFTEKIVDKNLLFWKFKKKTRKTAILYGNIHKNEDGSKNEKDLKNSNDSKNEDDLKNEEYLKNKTNPKNEDDLTM